ncbi:response regulator transcription factor [Balneatrix alpica]|uniref:Response regulator transcription factor n=1 Tax=Balneatrix alpica TaxID=75684 RepID=A0ABV5Z8G0_9GAMM|nr:response regulator transcription factor [Balneatrix alpica]
MSLPEATIYILDDDDALRDSLQWLLEAEGLQAQGYADPHAFFHAYDPERPGCLLLDIRMPGMSGLQVQQHLHELHITLPVIVMTGHGDVPLAVTAMKQGALDFLEKPFNDQTLLDRVQQALHQDLQQFSQRQQLQSLQNRYASLTKREKEVMHWVVRGLANKDIADTLGISRKTIEVHRANAMEKMAANSLAELVQIALQLGEV